jgi:hypothetical protein
MIIMPATRVAIVCYMPLKRKVFNGFMLTGIEGWFNNLFLTAEAAKILLRGRKGKGY